MTERDSFRDGRYHCPTCDEVIERASKEPSGPPSPNDEWGWLASYVPIAATAHPCGHRFRMDYSNIHRLLPV